MILLDTMALIRLSLGEPIQTAAMTEIARAEASDSALVSAVSLWEIETLARRTGRTGELFRPDAARWIVEALSRLSVVVVAFEAEDALALFDLPVMHADPGDRMLTATARRRNIPIVTDDDKLLALAKAGHLRAIPC